MTEHELYQKEQELKLREDNLKSQQTITMLEHQTITQLIPRVTEAILNELKSKHLCIQGERLVKMESNIETIMERQTNIKDDLKEHIDKLDKHLTKLYTKDNEHGTKIAEIENTIKVVKWVIGLVVAAGAYLTIKRV